MHQESTYSKKCAVLLTFEVSSIFKHFPWSKTYVTDIYIKASANICHLKKVSRKLVETRKSSDKLKILTIEGHQNTFHALSPALLHFGPKLK